MTAGEFGDSSHEDIFTGFSKSYPCFVTRAFHSDSLGYTPLAVVPLILYIESSGSFWYYSTGKRNRATSADSFMRRTNA